MTHQTKTQDIIVNAEENAIGQVTLTNKKIQQATPKAERQEQHPHSKPHLVEVKIDGNLRKIAADTYQVPVLKNLLGIPLDYELELVKGGKFHPLADGDTYKVHGHEEFVSHVRCGGSS